MRSRTITAVLLSIGIMVSFQLYVTKRYPSVNKTSFGETHASKGVVDLSKDVSRDGSVLKLSAERAESVQQNVEVFNIKSITTNVMGNRATVGFSPAHPFLGAVQSLNYQMQDDGWFVKSQSIGIGAIVDSEDGVSHESDISMERLDERTVEYASTAGDVRIQKRFEIDDSGLGGVMRVTFVNASEELISQPVGVVSAYGLSREESIQDRLSSVAIRWKANHGKIKRVRWHDLEKSPIRIENEEFLWIGVHNKYFAIVIEPKGSTPNSVDLLMSQDGPVVRFIHNILLSPNETVSFEYELFFGPMELSELGSRNYHEVLDFGVFGIISRAVLFVMFSIKNLIGSFGAAIILMTILINVLVYPLTFKSMASMKRIQEIQPKVEQVRAKYKDDPAKMNREMLELYKKYKINPMGGCLPMLIQMPVFVGLYRALSSSVELWGTPFLAIKDLSNPDALLQLPASVPFVGDAVNILPIFMAVGMFFQQKAMSTASTEQAQQMMKIFPIIFLIICYKMPSGLIIYWITHTVLTMCVQVVVKKSLGVQPSVA